MATYALNVYSQSPLNVYTMIGMAKDGNQIIGPYDVNGNLYDCRSLDICNGYKDPNSLNYTYVALTTFPYLVGCYGPGASVTFNSQCSTNLCS